jgi:hypothetical protein
VSHPPARPPSPALDVIGPQDGSLSPSPSPSTSLPSSTDSSRAGPPAPHRQLLEHLESDPFSNHYIVAIKLGDGRRRRFALPAAVVHAIAEDKEYLQTLLEASAVVARMQQQRSEGIA